MSLVTIPVWQENVVAGRGWIAVALVIFASWKPSKALDWDHFLFGGLNILGYRLAEYGYPYFTVPCRHGALCRNHT